MAENKMDKVESLLVWLASGEKDEDGNRLSDDDTQLVCDALEYYLNTHRQKNKMEQVAQMFGKKLNEPFQIKGKIYDFCFTENGLEEYGYVGNEHMLVRLLTGKAEIVEDEEREDD